MGTWVQFTAASAAYGAVMPALYLQSSTPPSYILQSVLHPPSPFECTATVRVIADTIMLSYKRSFLKTVLTLTQWCWCTPALPPAPKQLWALHSLHIAGVSASVCTSV